MMKDEFVTFTKHSEGYEAELSSIRGICVETLLNDDDRISSSVFVGESNTITQASLHKRRADFSRRSFSEATEKRRIGKSVLPLLD